MIIAVDGPAAAGKGTLARQLADHLGFHYLDTGALYRKVGLLVLQHDGDPANEADALAAAQNLDKAQFADEDLRTREAGSAASIVAQIPAVRAEILDFQRQFATRAPGTVLDGRDIGTVVCPDAQVKLFVTANVEERARRRFVELTQKGEQVELETIRHELAERDRRDTERAVAPLTPAEDAYLLDTSKLDIETAFQTALDIVKGS